MLLLELLLLEDLVAELLVVVVGRVIVLEDLVLDLEVVVGLEELFEDLLVVALVFGFEELSIVEERAVEFLLDVRVVDLVFAPVVDLFWLDEFNRVLLLYAELLFLEFLFPLI